MNKSLPSRPRSSSAWFEQLRRLLAQAREAGAEDAELAYDLMSLRAGFGLPERSAEFGDLLWSLAWHLGVRAPALDLRWLVSASLVLDKVHWGKLSLLKMLEQLEDLEAGFDRDNAREPDRQLAPLCDLAARDQRLLGLDGEPLRAQVREDLSAALSIIEDGGLFERAIAHFPMRRS